MPRDDVDRDPLVASYVEHRAMLVRMFTARLGSPAAAEDLVLYGRVRPLGPS